MGVSERGLTALQAFGPQVVATIKAFFDAEFYRTGRSDVGPGETEALAHYLRHGASELSDPSDRFSTYYYRERHPDVLAGSGHPFLHFAVRGRREGRRTLPPGFESARAFRTVREMLETGFDRDWYLARYPDVARSGVCPLLHYLEAGAAEGRDPSPDFSTDYYLRSNPDVADAGVNPLLHFLSQGHREGRRASPPEGAHRIAQLRALRSLDEMVTDWTRRDAPPEPIDAVALRRAIDRSGASRILVSLNHDDYRDEIGGVQLCIGHEERAAGALGLGFLALHPWQPLPRLAPEGSDPLVVPSLGGETLGVARMSEVVAALAGWSSRRRRHRRGRIAVAIHSLLGHSTEAAAQLARLSEPGAVHLWLHDYFTICTGYNLLRNGVSYCGAPEEGSPACGVCVHGEGRAAHRARIRALFEAAPVTVVSPSQVTLEIWRARSGIQAEASLVVPHCRILEGDGDPVPIDEDAPLRVAFAGVPAEHKGWPVFRELARRGRRQPDLEFLAFSQDAPTDPLVRHVPVRVTPEAPDAMIRALHDNRAEIAVMWASGPETFSLAAHEAIAAGALVLCPAHAGNIARLVTETGAGRCFKTEGELFDFFASGAAMDLARSRRAHRTAPGRLDFGRFTAGLVATEAAA
jgi:hypothetical protein